MIRVAVLTVTYNTGETIRPFLASVAGASKDPVAVVIADNGSADIDAPGRSVSPTAPSWCPPAATAGTAAGSTQP
ncbi:hypothetical protein Q9Q99_05915 [Curtobacterium flaccumfaciens]|nr:hypothetical protein Q9Q99_05915 [Curtobacterium flaccumfaciens]